MPAAGRCRSARDSGRECLSPITRCRARHPGFDVLALNELLVRLTALDPRKSRIVELRYFGGLSLEDTAGILDIAPRTVEREWRVARAWLHDQLTRDS